MYGNLFRSVAPVRTSVVMSLVPANRDIESFVHRTVHDFLGLRHLVWRQLPHNVLFLEKRLPGLDGRHFMPEAHVEPPGHDDGVTRELVVQGCFLILPVRICDAQNGAAAVGKRSDGISFVISG